MAHTPKDRPSSQVCGELAIHWINLAFAFYFNVYQWASTVKEIDSLRSPRQVHKTTKNGWWFEHPLSVSVSLPPCVPSMKLRSRIEKRSSRGNIYSKILILAVSTTYLSLLLFVVFYVFITSIWMYNKVFHSILSTLSLLLTLFQLFILLSIN